MSVDFEIYKYVNRELGADDIAVVQFLYGPAPGGRLRSRQRGGRAQDLTEWASGFGAVGGAEQADGDADRDGGDFLVWQRELGGGVIPPIANIPEPETIQLARVIAVLMAAFRAASASTKRGRG